MQVGGHHDAAPATSLTPRAGDIGAAGPVDGELQHTARVLDAMGVGYGAVDAQWRYLAFNDTAARMGLSTPAELVGRVMWECYPAMVGSEFERRYRRALQTGQVEVFESFYPAPLDIWVQVTALPHSKGDPWDLPDCAASAGPGEPSSAGRPVLEFMFSDVTAQRNAQTQAGLSATRQQALADLGRTALAMTEGDSVADLVTAITELGLRPMGCDAGAIAVPQTALDQIAPGPLEFAVHSSGDAGRDGLDPTRLFLEVSDPVYRALQTGEPVLLPDTAAASPPASGAAVRLSNAVSAAEFGSCSGAMACLPMRVGGQTIAVLTAVWPQAQSFDSDLVELLQTYAAGCAHALRRLTASAAERAAAQTARAAAAEQAGLVAIARALAGAETRDDVLAVLDGQGQALLQANGCGLCLREDDGTHVTTLITDSYAEVRTVVQRVPADFPLPAIASAAHGATYFLSDRDAAEQAFPGAEDVYAGAGVQASAALPLYARGRLLGCLSIGWATARTWTVRDRELLEAFAALTAQTLQRLAALDAEHAATVRAQRSADQQRALSDIAAALLEAHTRDDVLRVINQRGRKLLGAAGAGLALIAPDGQNVQILTTDYFNDQVQQHIAEMPTTTALPIVRAAVDGTAFFLPDRAAADALFPGCSPLYAAAGTQGSAELPLRSGGTSFGTLSIAFTDVHQWQPAEQQLLEAYAALTAQALQRIDARTAEQAASAAVARFSETMQRSLLTAPTQPDHLQIAVRYSPAAAEAHVGGDWYDAFLTAEGMIRLVIGDVSGHDRNAAAAMAQLRNILRGMGYTMTASPATVLTTLDRAARSLGVNAMASLILAQVEQTEAQRAAGIRLLRWSNAGHPPPLWISANGHTQFLYAPVDPIIGVVPSIARYDHEHILVPGDTVLLYTDGLIERRGAVLDDGLQWLAGEAKNFAGQDPETICDRLLGMVGDRTDDDVALLVLRAGA